MKILSKHKDRLSNFELLRIFAMFLIVLHHCNLHGVFSYWSNNSSMLHHVNNIICFLLSSCGQVGVSLFILLTGYFSCQQNFKLNKLLTIYLKTLFFSVLIFLIWLFIFPQKAATAWRYSLFPLTNDAYWFITTWLLLYAFSPLLNVILKSASPKMIKSYLILGTVIWVLFPVLNLKGLKYSDLVYFMYLYLLGASIKLKIITFSKNYITLLFLAVFCFILAMITTAVLFWKDSLYLWEFYKYESLNTIYTLSVSLYIFYLFKDLKINSLFINRISASMLGVYLLHDNLLVRPFLWHEILQIDASMNSALFIIRSLANSLGVFGVCIITDKMLSLVYNPLINFTEKQLLKIKFKQFSRVCAAKLRKYN